MRQPPPTTDESLPGADPSAAANLAEAATDGAPWALDDEVTDRPVRPHWVRELLTVVAFYLVYQQIRGFADTKGSTSRAFSNARIVVRAERWLHIFNEQAVQQAFLGARWFLRLINIYYGTLHFVITIVILIWLYFRRFHNYRHMRNLLGLTTALALIGYWAFPLAPPRMFLCSNDIPVFSPDQGWHVGKCFVDTLDSIGGLWSYYTPVAKAASNPFAAMPSLHFAWALWCGIVFFRFSKHPLVKVLGVLYPLLTLFAIVVTANHYWLDAVGGAVLLLAASAILHALERRRSRRAETLAAAPVDQPSPA